jgi:single-strand DNA-binding protein
LARAEPFAKYHKKGKPAFIEGSLRLDSWEDKNGGGKRSKLFVVADTWEFVGGGREEGGGGGGGYERTSGARSDAGGGDSWGGGEPVSADDTPF